MSSNEDDASPRARGNQDNDSVALQSQIAVIVAKTTNWADIPELELNGSNFLHFKRQVELMLHDCITAVHYGDNLVRIKLVNRLAGPIRDQFSSYPTTRELWIAIKNRFANKVNSHKSVLEARFFDQTMRIGQNEDPDHFLDRFATLVSECKAAGSTCTSPFYVQRLANCAVGDHFLSVNYEWDEKAHQQMDKPVEEHDDIYDVIEIYRRFHHRQKVFKPSSSSETSIALVTHARRDTDRAPAVGDTCPIHKGAGHSLQKCTINQALIREYLMARENGEDGFFFEIRKGNKKKSKEYVTTNLNPAPLHNASSHTTHYVAFSTMSAEKSVMMNNHWVLDSAAWPHMTNDINDLIEPRAVADLVQLGNTHTIPATHVGSSRVYFKNKSGDLIPVLLERTLYVPDLSVKLLSVRALRAMGFATNFDQVLMIQNHHTNDEFPFVDSNPLFCIESHSSHKQCALLAKSVSTQTESDISIQSATEMSTQNDTVNKELITPPVMDELLLHKRLGHSSAARIADTLRCNAVTGVDAHAAKLLKKMNSQHHKCVNCVKGKLDSGSHPRSDSRADAPLMLTHSDVGTFNHTLSMQKNKYFLVLLDDHTKYVKVIGLKNRASDTVMKAIREYMKNMERRLSRHNYKMMIFRSDGGGEYEGELTRLLADEGIIHQKSPPYVHQANGAAENLILHLKDNARSMMIAANLPDCFWEYALQMAAYVHNRLVSRSNTASKNKTPYEAMFGKKPDISHIRVFGCKVFVHVPKETRKSIDDKARECVYLGHDDNQRAYLVYDGKNVFLASSVVFKEDEYAYTKSNTTLTKSTTTRTKTTNIIVSPATSNPYSVLANNNDDDDDDDDDCSANVNAPQSAAAAINNVQESKVAVEADQHVGVDQPVGDDQHVGVEDHNNHPLYEADDDESVGVLPVQDADSDSQSNSSSSTDILSPQAASIVPPAQPQPVRKPRAKLADRMVDQVIEIKSWGPQSEVNNVNVTSTTRARKPTERYNPAMVTKKLFGDLPPVKSYIGMKPPSLNDPTYKEAMESEEREEWKAADQRELNSLWKRGTWEFALKTPNMNPIPPAWVHHRKTDSRGLVKSYKGRVVARGDRQVQGVDFYQTYAPVVHMVTLRAFLAVAAMKDYEIHQMDVSTAFLYGDLDEVIHMYQPPGMNVPDYPPDKYVLKLNKAIYGLRQAAKAWYKVIDAFMKSLGFKRLDEDHGLYEWSKGTTKCMITIYVDDLLIACNDTECLMDIKKKFAKRFEMTDEGEVKHILGMIIERDRKNKTIALSQPNHINNLLETSGLQDAYIMSAPMEEGLQLKKDMRSSEEIKAQPKYMPDEKLCKYYQSVLGSLNYIMTSTRPDIAYAVSILSQFSSAPQQPHVNALKRVVRYLKGTKDRKLVLGGQITKDKNNPFRLRGYTDADWGNCLDTRRSTTGYIFFLGDGPISWTSKRQHTVALSTCEAEYMALAAGAQEALHLSSLLRSMGFLGSKATIKIYGDNKGSIDLANNEKSHRRSRHIDIRYHFIREKIVRKQIELEHVPTQEMVADGFTKPLGRNKQDSFLHKMNFTSRQKTTQ